MASGRLHNRQFERFLKRHGITAVHKKTGHAALFKGGVFIYTVSNHPQGPSEHAADNSIKDLVRLGHLPADVVYKGKIYKGRKQ